MITGIVNAFGEARILLTLQGHSGQETQIEAIIDTGFNGFLTLPPHVINELDLMRLSRGMAQLADGGETIFNIYSTVVLWDHDYKEVEVDEMASVPLVGMSMLKGLELYIHAIEGGSVRIGRASDG